MKNFKGFLKFFFLIILSTYTFVFFSVNAGYYEYKNYSYKRLTEMQIKQFEQDIKNNVEIDINKYHIPDSNFNDGEKRIGLKISEAGSKFFKKGLVTVFDLLSKLIDN
jgi:hypothetical protein